MKHKKILLWVSGSLACLILLLVGGMLLLPYLINLEPVMEKILAVLSQQVGGRVEYQRLDLSYFPQPRVKVHQVRISIPEKAAGTFKSIQVYPELLAILRGKLRIKTIQVESPNVNISLPKEREKTKKESKPTIREEIEDAIGRASGIFPNLNVILKNGRLNLFGESKPILSLSHLDGQIVFPTGSVTIDITSRSNLWEKMSLEATLNPVKGKGMGHVEVTNFYPHKLPESLFSSVPFNVSDSRLNLKMNFKTEGQDVLQAEIEGSIPLISFYQEEKEGVIKARKLKGSFNKKGGEISVVLTELKLDSPQLRLSGRFEIDQKAPLYVLEVQGREVDIASTREAALMLAGELPITKIISNIAKKGKVPLITFQSRGRSIPDLDETANFTVKGRLLEGTISIPVEEVGWKEIDITLEKVSGEAAVSKGILEAKNVTAQWENETFREGKLRVGLEGENPPLHLETVAEVDLSVLPPLLNRLIKDRTLLEEMARLAEIKGRAVGTLVLGESKKTIKAKIDIQEIQLLARHDRIPYSVTIDRGKVIFDEERLEVRNLTGKIGNSSFSDLAARVDLRKEASLEVFSGRSVLSLEEIYSWLSSYGSLREALKNFESVKGRISLSDMRLTGPLRSPEKWDFDTAGELKDLVVNTSLLPGPLGVTDGKFRLQPETIVFTDLQTRFLDASLQVSGTLYDYRRGLDKAELDFSGGVTPKDIQWLSDSFKVKKDIPIHSSIRISGAHLSWQKGEYTSFRGDFTTGKNLQVFLDISQTLAGLKVERFALRDEASDCLMTLELRDRVAKVGFSGELSERTLDKIFSGYQFQNGWLKGDFRATLLLDQLMRSTVQGRLEADDLSLPWQLEKPLEIEHISLTGDGNHISIAEARFTWEEMPFVLSGDVGFSEKRILLNVDLSTERVDLDQVTKSLSKGTNAEGTRDSSNLQVEGTIRFKTNSLHYGRFAWDPFRADITVGQNVVEVNIEEARLCGISTTGIVKVVDQELSIDLQPALRSRELESTAKCLLDETIRATGDFELKGRIFAQAKPEDLFPALRGKLEFQAKNGKVYYMVELARILEFVNLTEVYRGKLPDMRKEGLAYKLIIIRGSLLDGKLIINEAMLDGPTLQMAAQGELDLTNQKIDATVLVAPLRTVDRIINLLPVIRNIFAGTLLTIPVKVSGDLKDPKVTALSPSAIGSELTGILKRTLQLPFEIINPLLPKKNNEEK